jgi:hypothetical protein
MGPFARDLTILERSGKLSRPSYNDGNDLLSIELN